MIVYRVETKQITTKMTPKKLRKTVRRAKVRTVFWNCNVQTFRTRDTIAEVPWVRSVRKSVTHLSKLRDHNASVRD